LGDDINGRLLNTTFLSVTAPKSVFAPLKNGPNRDT
jgi:hypothetical protein